MTEIRGADGSVLIMQGRTGLLFKRNGNQYFIDSERLMGPEYGIAVYANSVKRQVDDNRTVDLPVEEKKNVFFAVIDLLKHNNIYVEIIGEV